MYQTEFEGTHHELGTSGFLYRSNKLMYDHRTKSFWSTLKGEPVVGPLVEKRIQLKRSHVVTTSWGEWKRRHPDTSVLSLATGYRRDYGEGVAYRDYFSTDKLMFTVPKIDRRLRNKDEVVALREGNDQLALSAEYLAGHTVFHGMIADQDFVIFTDKSGANRVFESDDIVFQSWDGEQIAIDKEGRRWQVHSDSLRLGEQRLERLPSHRAFWFGWYSQFPNSRLIK